MSDSDRYYALCQQGEIAFLELGKNDSGTVLAIAVYTASEGEAQNDHLDTYEDAAISAVSPDQLLDAMRRGVPDTVFVDGRKLAGSVFMGRLKEVLGLPTQHSQTIWPDDHPRN